MVCCMLYDMCAVVTRCELLNGMLAVVRNVSCCMIRGLLYDMWAVVWYVGCCMICGLLYGMWVVV